MVNCTASITNRSNSFEAPMCQKVLCAARLGPSTVRGTSALLRPRTSPLPPQPSPLLRAPVQVSKTCIVQRHIPLTSRSIEASCFTRRGLCPSSESINLTLPRCTEKSVDSAPEDSFLRICAFSVGSVDLFFPLLRRYLPPDESNQEHCALSTVNIKNPLPEVSIGRWATVNIASVDVHILKHAPRFAEMIWIR